MYTPETSKLFQKRINPSNGVPHYVLKERAAIFQQGFYFVNNSMTTDGRYLWFYASFPPMHNADCRMLGFIDFEEDSLTVCNDTLFNGASPWVHPVSGEVYFTWNNMIFKRKPKKDAVSEMIFKFKSNRLTKGIATHLTPLDDECNSFFVDIREGNNDFSVGVANIKTGEYELWYKSPFLMNHGQINPANSKLALCAYDGYTDIETGESPWIPTNKDGVYERLWTVEPGGKATLHAPIGEMASHEWWSSDGEKIYYVSKSGINFKNIHTGEHKTVHKCDPWHAHTTKDETLYVYDDVLYDKYPVWYRGCASAVRLFNAKTGKVTDIVSRMSENNWTPDNQCDYHIDPHPRFCENEKYIIFTTSNEGGADLAVANVEEVLTFEK